MLLFDENDDRKKLGYSKDRRLVDIGKGSRCSVLSAEGKDRVVDSRWMW